MRGHHATPWQRLRGLLRAEQSDLFVVIVYSVVIGLLSLVVPVAVQWLVNTIAFGTLVQPLIVLTIFVFIALGFASVLTAMRSWVVELMQQRLFVRVASDVAYRLPRVKVEAFDKVHGPELVNRFFDVVTVQKSASALLVEGLSILLQALIGMLLLAVYHPLLLVFDFILLVIIVVILFPLGRGAERTAIQESRAKYALVAWFEEIARYPVTFKSGAGHGYGAERSDVLVRSYLAARRNHFRIVLRQIIGFLGLQAIASAALLGIGGWLVMERQLTLGQLVAAELVVTMVVGGLSKFAKKLETFYDMLAALDKLGHLIDLPLEQSGGERLPASPFPARLTLDKVKFGYPGKGPVLNGVSLEVAPGERVGLIGTLGSGKSSLVDLLYGLRSPQSGSIQIDGHDFRDLSVEDLRSHIVVVRSNEVFEGTVAENLRIGREHLSAADLWRALRAVGLEEDVQALPHGLSAELATGGQPLSRGQSGRLMVARALAGHPRLLILDESLDRIDDDHDRETLFSALFSSGAPWTLLVVSSSPEILSRCDRVLALNGGDITEIGSSATNPVRE
ncbi:MAG: ATP-binding cassette domain-containing protein [Bryobacterales bacterium]|nr:ATP-binding cassette domain-containing protein [Bryobacterales bacterium]